MTFDYIERNGLLYPNIVIEDADRIEELGKYGKLRLEYLHSQKPQMYRELLITGKLIFRSILYRKMIFGHGFPLIQWHR